MVVEIADSSLAEVREMAAAVYGPSGIPVYWIVNVVNRQVEVYSDPGPQGYRSRVDFPEGQVVPVVIDGQQLGEIAVDDILPSRRPGQSPKTPAPDPFRKKLTVQLVRVIVPLVFPLINPQQLGRFRFETTQFLICSPVILHPDRRPLVPLAGLFRVAELFVGHGQEEPVEAVPAFAKLHAFLERCDRGIPIAGAVVSHAQCVPVGAYSRLEFDGPAGEFDAKGRFAKLLRKPRHEVPGQDVPMPRVSGIERCAFSSKMFASCCFPCSCSVQIDCKYPHTNVGSISMHFR